MADDDRLEAACAAEAAGDHLETLGDLRCKVTKQQRLAAGGRGWRCSSTCESQLLSALALAWGHCKGALLTHTPRRGFNPKVQFSPAGRSLFFHKNSCQHPFSPHLIPFPYLTSQVDLLSIPQIGHVPSTWAFTRWVASACTAALQAFAWLLPPHSGLKREITCVGVGWWFSHTNLVIRFSFFLFYFSLLF